MHTNWHEHFFSKACTDEVHGRFDAVEDENGIYVLDVGPWIGVRCDTRDDAVVLAQIFAKDYQK